jgi:dolichol-phosphate mannosyltransferase
VTLIQKPLVIVPTYNEEENILSLIERIFSAVPKIHVLFIDDNSVDATRARIRDAQAKYPNQVFIIERAGKLGLGTAYIAGFKWGLAHGYDAMIEMDADHSHDPKELKTFIELLGKYDAVVGSRYIEGGRTENWSFIRKCVSMFGSFYSRTILGMPVRDLTGGFNAWRNTTIEAIDPDAVRSQGYSFQIELKYRAFLKGKTVTESPIVFSERRAGQSKMSFHIVLEAMHRVWGLRKLRGQV